MSAILASTPSCPGAAGGRFTRGVPSMSSLPLRVLVLPTLVVAAVTICGCGTTTGTRTASGSLMGAAAGAAIGSLTAEAGAGALLGAGVGALGGYLYDQHLKGHLD